MRKDEKSVDSPHYDPNLKHIPFPPTDQDYQAAKQRHADGVYDKDPPPPKKPFYEQYEADVATPDPSQTMPGAADIRDPNLKLNPDEDLSHLSPDVDLNLKEPGSFD